MAAVELQVLKKSRVTFMSSDSEKSNNDIQTSFLSQPSIFLDPKQLENLFSPQDYDRKKKKQLLHDLGGISHILDGLRVWHDIGLTMSEISNERRKRYGVNTQNQHYIRRVISRIASELANPLVYSLLIIQICVFLVECLTDDSSLQLDTLLSIFMLCVVVIVRSIVSRHIESYVFKRLQQRHTNMVRVRRDGEQVEVLESELLVGDVLLLREKDFIMVDGILTKSQANFQVNENLTILQNDEVRKRNAWDESLNSDPFILAGTQILEGKGEMVVCTVGQRCSIRVITHMEGYKTKKIQFLSRIINHLNKFFKLTKTMVFSLMFIEVTIEIIHLSPLVWQDARLLFLTIVQCLALLFMVDKQNIPDYLYSFVQNRCVSDMYKVVKKQAVEQLLSVDVLLIEENLLKPNEGVMKRENSYTYEFQNIEVLQRIASAIDLKILTTKTSNQCKIRRIKNVYNVNKYLMEEKDIRDLKNCRYIADCGIPGVVDSIIKIFTVLGYKVGFAAEEVEENQFNSLILTTDKKSTTVAWIRIDPTDPQQSIQSLLKVSTAMHLIKGAYALVLINNTIILGLAYIMLRKLDPWQILFLALIQNYFIYAISRYIGQTTVDEILLPSTIKTDVAMFNISTGLFYFYMFLRLQQQSNQFVFLICNAIMRNLYVLNYGIYVQNRKRFLQINYVNILLILLINVGYSYYISKTVQQELMLMVAVSFLQLLHILHRRLVKRMKLFN